jgi:hypothetical protein
MWILIINNVCVSVSLYFIVLFYQGTKRFIEYKYFTSQVGNLSGFRISLISLSEQTSVEALQASLKIYGDQRHRFFLLLAKYSTTDVCLDPRSDF